MKKNNYLSNKELNFYKKNGYLLKPNLIDKKTINQINKKINFLKSNNAYNKNFEYLTIKGKNIVLGVRVPIKLISFFIGFLII